MFNKLLSLCLVALLINLTGAPLVYAASKEEKEVRFAEKVKASVLKLGTGEAARVKIKLSDKTRLAGYISAADGEGFYGHRLEDQGGYYDRLSTSQERPGAQSLDGCKDCYRCWCCRSNHFYYSLVYDRARQ